MLINLKINGVRIDINNDFEFRLNSIKQNAENFSQRGGEFSTNIVLPKSKVNTKFFNSKDEIATKGQFYFEVPYLATLEYNGTILFNGTFKLNRITRNGFEGELSSANSSWIGLLEGKQLCTLAYDNNDEPTWFNDFEGYTAFNRVNEQTNKETDYILPTIVYNNTPITDYLDFSDTDIFGTFDGSGNQVVSPKDFPNDFITRNAFFGNREGLTFEDFPPALYYSNVIKKVFSSIGYEVKGEIFEQDWFNKMYMPYVGDGYKWNWRTIAELRTSLLQRGVDTTVGEPEIVRDVFSPLVGKSYKYSALNVPFADDLALRYNPVYNFKKGLIDPINADRGAQYVCPADGKYKIKVFSNIFMTYTGITATINDLLDIGGGGTDYGYDDAILIITRRDTGGDYVFFPEDSGNDIFQHTATWMTGDNPSFMTNPSDIIAYYSPKRAQLYANNDVRVSGSPLSNFTEQVQSNLDTFGSTIVSSNEINLLNGVDMEISIDLKKNERINAYWVVVRSNDSIIQPAIMTGSINYSAGFNFFNVEYLCGYEGLDLAGNLPCDDLVQFIGNFIRYFNLSFNVKSNTITFDFNKKYTREIVNPYDITDRVEQDSETLSPTISYKELIVGYNNDTNDRLLNSLVAQCDGSDPTRRVLEYGNYVYSNKKNYYAKDQLVVRNGFSATRFVNGQLELTDTDNYTVTLVSTTHPITGQVLVKGVDYTPPTLLKINPFLPSIQSQDSFDQRTIGDLTYDYNYTPRILYHLGTTSTYLGYGEEFRIKLGSPQLAYVLNLNKEFWIRPTISSFDNENNSLLNLPSLRYDVNLFNEYFDNEVEMFNKSVIVEVEAYLTNKDWNEMTQNRLIKYRGVVFKLLEISNYDPVENNACKIKMLKLI